MEMSWISSFILFWKPSLYLSQGTEPKLRVYLDSTLCLIVYRKNILSRSTHEASSKESPAYVIIFVMNDESARGRECKLQTLVMYHPAPHAPGEKILRNCGRGEQNARHVMFPPNVTWPVLQPQKRSLQAAGVLSLSLQTYLSHSTPPQQRLLRHTPFDCMCGSIDSSQDKTCCCLFPA